MDGVVLENKDFHGMITFFTFLCKDKYAKWPKTNGKSYSVNPCCVHRHLFAKHKGREESAFNIHSALVGLVSFIVTAFYTTLPFTFTLGPADRIFCYFSLHLNSMPILCLLNTASLL